MRTYRVKVWYTSLLGREDRAAREVYAEDIAGAVKIVTGEMETAAKKAARDNRTFEYRITDVSET